MDRFKRSTAGFSLVEMVVTLGVMVMIMAMTFANFPKIRDQIALTLATRELALSIRKAQSYAIGVREFDSSYPTNLCKLGYYEPTDGFVRYPPYGVALSKAPPAAPEEGNDQFTYSIFGDINCNAFLLQSPVYQSVSEFVSSVKIQNGAQIATIKGYVSGSAIPEVLRSAQIVYQRPTPSVTLVGTSNSGNGSCGNPTCIYTGRIEIALTSGNGLVTKKIILRPSGQISIE